MTKAIKNKEASIRAKLLNIARTENRPFDSLLLLYMQERLLYRLSISKYVNHFVLKGGMFMLILTELKGRPTMDIDLLAIQMSNDLVEIENIFREIAAAKYNDDGLVFNKESIEIERIIENADYQGIRVKMTCSLGSARKAIRLDIGFGDVIVPAPYTMEWPTIFDSPPLYIKTYSLESVISEKFHAMISLSAVNSRMKDFYDIYSLLNMNDFTGKLLYMAIRETFSRRQTKMDVDTIIFTQSFRQNSDRNTMWKAFLKKINMESISFEEVMLEITTFTKPVYDSILNNTELLLDWNHNEKEWHVSS